MIITRQTESSDMASIALAWQTKSSETLPASFRKYCSGHNPPWEDLEKMPLSREDLDRTPPTQDGAMRP